MFAEFFAGMNETLKGALTRILPESDLSTLIINNAFLVLTALAVLVVVIFLIIAFFFDFITDAWKIPLGSGIDVLKYLALANPWWAAASAVLGAILFIFISDAKFMKWVFAVISVAAAVLAVMWGDLIIGVLIALAPLNTMMIFVSTLID
jgi:hypothetical protein